MLDAPQMHSRYAMLCTNPEILTHTLCGAVDIQPVLNDGTALASHVAYFWNIEASLHRPAAFAL
jgi:hypothetical protein